MPGLVSFRTSAASVGTCFHRTETGYAAMTLGPDTRSLRSLLRDDNEGRRWMMTVSGRQPRRVA
jgi:hypothetical protein